MTQQAWHQDPAEIDRTIEGELPPAEREAREAQIAADADLAARVDARRRFLDGLASAGARYRADLASRVPETLHGRVRDALAAPNAPAPRVLRWAVAAAAVLLVGLGAGFFLDDQGDDAVAMPPAVLEAAEVARDADPGPQGCRENNQAPLRFPPVRDGLRIWACAERHGGMVAKLYRPEELPSIGYAAMPAPGVPAGPEVGRTDLGDTVVFDIRYGDEAHYIAVRKQWLDRQRQLTPGRESCRACHHLSRVGQENPHRIIVRSWKPITD